MNAGDAVLLRSVYRGRVRWCFPHRFVDERDGRFVLYLQPGNSGKHKYVNLQGLAPTNSVGPRWRCLGTRMSCELGARFKRTRPEPGSGRVSSGRR